MAKYNDKNEEIPDNTPVEMPLGYTEPESLEQVIARMIAANDFRKSQEAQGMESFEEADDFDVMDEGDIVSDHELTPMQEEYVVPKEQRRSAPPVVDREAAEEEAPEPAPKVGKKRANKGKAVVAAPVVQDDLEEETLAST